MRYNTVRQINANSMYTNYIKNNMEELDHLMLNAKNIKL